MGKKKKRFLDDFQGAQSNLPTVQKTIQVLIDLSLQIAQDTGEANVAKEMKSSLDNCSNLFAQVEKNLPLILNRNKNLLGHLQRFDEDVQKCHLWLNEAKQTLNRYSISVPLKRIEEFLEQNRVRNRNEMLNERETERGKRFRCFSTEFHRSNGPSSTDHRQFESINRIDETNNERKSSFIEFCCC